MEKGGIILIVAAVVIAIVAGAFFYLTGSPETVAYLNIESGKVEVDIGHGWQGASDQMELRKDCSVRTLDDGEASIVFFESDIMELSPNTEVSIAQLVASQIKVNQKTGSTWNRVSKLTGTREYTVETPNSVATVRGTGFGVNVSSEGDEIVVDEGTVDCGVKGGTLKQIAQYRTCMIKNNQLTEGEATREQLVFMKKRINFQIMILKRMQLKEINKKRFILNIVKKRYNLSDENIRQFFEDVNSGKKNLDEVKKKIPVRLKLFDKLERITRKIVELNNLAAKIDEKLASMQ